MQSLTGRVTDRLHWLFLLLAGGFGLALVLMTPPNGGSDEISHEVKIVRVASGNLFGADPSIPMPDLLRWHGAFSNIAMPDVHRRFSKAELGSQWPAMPNGLFAAIACVSVVLIALPLYAFATPTHEASISGLQGRYFIPTLVILLAAGCVRMPGWFRIVGVALIGLPCVALTYTLALIRWRYFGS